MADSTVQAAPGSDRSTFLALERTRVAYERTMLAWVRTATSLITFGFSVYKFFQLVRAGEPKSRLVGPEEFGLIMVGLGLLSLLLATLEYRRNIRLLVTDYPSRPHSLAVVVAFLVSVLGIGAFLVILFHQ